jgi:hypothetical protein
MDTNTDMIEEGQPLSGASCTPFVADCRAARAVWGREDAWSGDAPSLAQRAWQGLQYSAANAEQWSTGDQISLESARIEFDARQRLAFSANR